MDGTAGLTRIPVRGNRLSSSSHTTTKIGKL